MNPHARVLLFCLSLFVVPVLWWAIDRFVGPLAAVTVPGVLVLGLAFYAWLGDRGGPSVGSATPG